MKSVRDALQERELTLGSWIQIGHPAVAEIMAAAGYDWIAVDCEHTEIDTAGFAQLARAMVKTDTPPLVRVRENDTLAIRQVLDLGAQGVIVPLINTAEEARKAVAAAKYPPDGVRGFAFSRANAYGVHFDQYVRTANDSIAVVVMIESKEAVDNIQAILEVDGVDGVFIGPYDLSGSMGIPGETSHKSVTDACRSVAEACEHAGKSAGIHVVLPTAEAVSEAIASGFTFVALGMDTVFLDQAAREALSATRGLASRQ